MGFPCGATKSRKQNPKAEKPRQYTVVNLTGGTMTNPAHRHGHKPHNARTHATVHRPTHTHHKFQGSESEGSFGSGKGKGRREGKGAIGWSQTMKQCGELCTSSQWPSAVFGRPAQEECQTVGTESSSAYPNLSVAWRGTKAHGSPHSPATQSKGLGDERRQAAQCHNLGPAHTDMTGRRGNRTVAHPARTRTNHICDCKKYLIGIYVMW